MTRVWRLAVMCPQWCGARVSLQAFPGSQPWSCPNRPGPGQTALSDVWYKLLRMGIPAPFHPLVLFCAIRSGLYGPVWPVGRPGLKSWDRVRGLYRVAHGSPVRRGPVCPQRGWTGNSTLGLQSHSGRRSGVRGHVRGIDSGPGTDFLQDRLSNPAGPSIRGASASSPGIS